MLKVKELKEMVLAEVWLKAYDGEGNVIFEVTYDEVPEEYYNYEVEDFWIENDNGDYSLSFHISRY